MFVSDEILVPVGFSAAQARLANLIRGGLLAGVAEAAYQDGVSGKLRVGPSPVISRLVRAEFRDLVTHGESAVLTLRWQAAGPGGGLFPVLDADITVTPAGDDATSLRLDGAYRPPLGAVGAGLDRAVLHRIAAATIRTFITAISDAVANPAAERAAGHERRQPGWSPEPGTP